MSKRSLVVLALVLLVTGAGAAHGDLPKPARKQVREKLKAGPLYLKVDAPCVVGRHPFGVYYSPLVEVSPDGVNTEEQGGVGFGMYHVDSAYWGIRVNDAVEFDDLEFDGNTFEAEFVGVGDAEDEQTVVKFTGLDSYEDFEAAFEHVFSTRPLQDLHDDWSAEVKAAIGDRRLEEGMTKRQVYYVTGAPESFERSTDDGKEIEVWTLRQRSGMKMGFFRMSAETPTGLPSTLRFEDGVLANVVGKGSDALDLE